jgi:hypothetical protein
MYWGALFFSFLIMPTASFCMVQEQGGQASGAMEDRKVQLAHFPEHVDEDAYNNFSDLINTLLKSSGKNLLNGCTFLKKKLEANRSRLVSDVFISTIHDLILRGKNEDLRNLQRMLIMLNCDEHIFRALQVLPQDRVLSLLKNNKVIRDWWDASQGKEWLQAKEVFYKPALEFAEEYIRLHKKLQGETQSDMVRELAVLVSKKDQEAGISDEDEARINEIKRECARELSQERFFRQAFYLTPNQAREAYGAGLFSSGGNSSSQEQGQDQPEWKNKFRDEAELKNFVSRIDLLMSPESRAKEETIQVQVPAHFMQQANGTASDAAGKAPLVQNEDAVAHNKPAHESLVDASYAAQLHPIVSDLRVWLGVGGFSIVAMLYNFYRLKDLERTMHQENLWMNWSGHLSIVQLKDLPARNLVDLLSQDILTRRRAKKLFDSNEKILLDFLSEVEHEMVMINRYRSRSGFIKRVGLGALFCLDATMADKTEEGLLRLQVIKQKVLEYILEMKVENNIRARKVAA